MIQDKVRTSTYASKSFVLTNPILFCDAIVLDVGCGIGILSLLAAKSRTKRVYVVDASDIAEKAEQIVRVNGLETSSWSSAENLSHQELHGGLVVFHSFAAYLFKTPGDMKGIYPQVPVAFQSGMRGTREKPQWLPMHVTVLQEDCSRYAIVGLPYLWQLLFTKFDLQVHVDKG
ncbi:hypothetical protein M405DRAFT_869396 [Rhizopogon salebrosus TDB-379]|nr:hypothetical protein M405DRAFT_869396 [Rhizopogon salebrosus TDB-379]